MVKGKNLIVSCATSGVIAASKSCDFEIDTDFIEVCSPTDGEWSQSIPTISRWGVSCNMLMTTAEGLNVLRNIISARSILQLSFHDSSYNIRWGGSAYIKAIEITGRVGSLAILNVTFQPSGPLYTAEWKEVTLSSIASRFVISSITSSAITMVALGSTTGIIGGAVNVNSGGSLRLINQVVAISEPLSTIHTLLLSSESAENVNTYLNSRIAIIAPGGSTKTSVLPEGEYTLLSMGYSVVQVKQL